MSISKIFAVLKRWRNVGGLEKKKKLRKCIFAGSKQIKEKMSKSKIFAFL